MDEYDRQDALYYDYYSTGVPGDVAFYVEEARKAGSPVLELGCGTGRILIPVAQAGVEIVGLDRAPSMLAVAREKVAQLPRDVQERISLVEGDMRDFALGRGFTLVMIPYRAFLHLLTVEDQKRALRSIRDHLVAGGRLVLNVFDPSLEMIVAHRTSLGSALKLDSEFTDPATGRRVLVWDTREYQTEEQTLRQYFVFEELDEGGNVVAKRFNPLVLRYLFRYEMQHLLELSGFRVEALYGDFARGPFRSGREQVWVAARA
ncbi:MAG: class I SAM-dependent methyltransferase [Candidatus Bipolaricaulota bacterium]|nr:class I SAM-dependent methyltransferase [Candidatus Bipolaricaulota bacterium]